jgi:hypothetical protein
MTIAGRQPKTVTQIQLPVGLISDAGENARWPGRGDEDMASDGGLAAWAEQSGRRRAEVRGPGRVRFAFYGRVSTEDWQDPVTSRARQRDQAEALVRGHGVIVAEFFDAGQSRTAAGTPPP